MRRARAAAPLPFAAIAVAQTRSVAGTFSTIPTTAAGVTGDRKYAGAAAVGQRVFFAPFYQDNVGALDKTGLVACMPPPSPPPAPPPP